MPLETFDPSIRPSQGTKFQPKVSFNEADFGDGYSQNRRVV
jgi:phage-related protein